MGAPLRVAVIGAGAFGRNHLRVLDDLSTLTAGLDTSDPPTASGTLSQSVQLAAVVDRDPAIRSGAAAKYRIPGFASVDQLLAAQLDLHAATVCVPTVAHSMVAEHLLAAGLDVLLEKPLTATLAEADHLITLARRTGRILAAGHLERFNPAVGAALTRLTRPMFFEAHRLSVFTPRSLDVDVVLDLMIHDLDILLTMARSPVREVRAVGLPVLSRNVDIANVRLEFESGAVANLTASRVSTEQVRKLRLFQPAQYLSLDYARQELLTINVKGDAGSSPTTMNPSSRPEPTPTDTPSSRPEAPSAAVERPLSPLPLHPSAGLTFDKLDLPRAEPLRLELEDFLQAVATRSAPRVPGEAARAALALALDINTAMTTHARRIGLTNKAT